MAEDMTEEEAKKLLDQFSESKESIPSVFLRVIKSDDTLKTANLSEEELGTPHLPVRTYKELALFSKDVCSEQELADYFNAMSEIQTASSLSKEALLLKLLVTSKKEISDVTPTNKRENKGWFKGKNKQQPPPLI